MSDLNRDVIAVLAMLFGYAVGFCVAYMAMK